MSADCILASCGISPLADIRDGEGRDGRPELVIRGERTAVAMPVLPRRRDQIREAKGESFRLRDARKRQRRASGPS